MTFEVGSLYVAHKTDSNSPAQIIRKWKTIPISPGFIVAFPVASEGRTHAGWEGSPTGRLGTVVPSASRGYTEEINLPSTTGKGHLYFVRKCVDFRFRSFLGRLKNLWRRNCVRRAIFRIVEGLLCLQHDRWVIVRPIRGHLTPKMNITFFIRN